jgi:hypothetical protein
MDIKEQNELRVKILADQLTQSGAVLQLMIGIIPPIETGVVAVFYGGQWISQEKVLGLFSYLLEQKGFTVTAPLPTSN